MALRVGLEEIVEIKSRLAKELFGALLLKAEQATLNGTDAGGGDVAILRLEILGVIADVLEHGLKVFEVEEEELVVVGNLEDESEDAFLGIVEIKETAQEERAHFGNGGANRMALFAEDIPAGGGIGEEGEVGEFEFFDTVRNFGIVGAGLADAGEVAFDVGGKHGHADAGEGLRHDLESDGFTGAGGAGDQAVSIGHLREEIEGRSTLRDQKWVGHG